MSRDKKWTDESPVDVAWLGPLWPGGEPEWRKDAKARASKAATDERSDASAAIDPAIVVVIDLGDATIEEGQEVLRALNDYHIAAGGLGLEFEVDGNHVIARKAVCV